MNDEHISAGEFTRWQAEDRAWKGKVLDHLIDHGERLARVEGESSRAELAAARTKRWAVVGTVAGTLLNTVLMALGLKLG